MLCDHNFSSSMYILLNKTAFKNRTFILMGCREYLYISVCIWYEEYDSFTQMKRWNAHSDSQSSSGDVVHVFMSSLRRHAHFSVRVW